jgi:hypothetical protein
MVNFERRLLEEVVATYTCFVASGPEAKQGEAR